MMQKDVNPILMITIIVVIAAIIGIFYYLSGRPPVSGVTDHTQLKAPSGFPAPPWARKGGGASASPTVSTAH